MVLAAVPAMAQVTETGIISGTVTDVDGNPLPGVTVTLDSVEIPSQTAFTRVNGTYRFVALPAGEYTVTFALTGFTTMINEGAVVNVDATTSLNVQMTLASVEETVTVTASTPVVDVKKSGLSTNLSEEYMQNIPSARDPWVMMEHTPGLQIDRQNIGGSEGGQQSGFNAAGSDEDDTMWTYDGAEVTDMAATGASPFYYDFDAFEEISITTGGNDPSIATGGMRVNFVTKRGGNSWRGSGRFYMVDEGTQVDPIYDRGKEEYKSGVNPDEYYPGYIGNAINNIKDYGVEIGGPIVRDHLFVWGSIGRQDIKLLVGSSEDNTQLKHYHLKGTGHIGNSDVLSFTYLQANKTKQGRGAAANRDPDATHDQEGPSPVYTVKWQHTFSDNMYLESVFNHTGLGFNLNPQGCTSQSIAVADCGVEGPQAKRDYDTGEYWSSSWYYDTIRPLYNFRLDANNYLAEKLGGDHEFKYGYSYRWAEVSSSSGYSGGAMAVFDAGVANEAWIVGPGLDAYRGVRHSLYVGDTWSLDRLTLNLGARADFQTSIELPSGSGASPLAPDQFPARSFDGNDPGWGWNSLSPRFGLTYDLTGDGRAIARFNAARYDSQMPAWELSYLNTTGWAEIDYEWTDLNGNTFIDPGETGDVLWFGGFDPDDPNAPSGNVITETTPPKTDEIIAGVDYEVVRNLALGASYIWKKYGNATWSPGTGITSANYFPVPYDLQGSQNPNGPLTVYHLDQYNPTWDTYRQRPDYNTKYNGIELTMTKRFSDNWMGNASFNWTQYKQYYPTPASYIDPTNVAATDGNYMLLQSGGSGRSGTFYGSARYYFKASGMYQFPHGITLGGFFQVREGYLNPIYTRTDSRPNGIGRSSPWIQPVDQNILPTYWNMDLRVEKTFDFPGDVRLHLIGDMFNLFNNGINLAIHNQYNSSNYDLIREVMQGFTFRLGLRLVLR
jgi:hypothetical protein